ncbi:MAG: hypothetical protein JWM86_2352 [Thermoleophilia bacterium]|nr:hypothetical protein [Thermoleophilia bacterium]
MATYQHAAPAPSRSSGTDVAAWALIALVVALICAGVGWAVARQDVPSRQDVAETSELAAREALVRGESTGFAAGARLGRNEAALKAKGSILAERRAATREGYDAGFQSGRSKAGDPDAYLSSTAGAGAYPSAGYEDILAAGLFGADAPGFSDSAYDSLGYGAGVTSPYLGTTSRGTSLGDDASYPGLGY